MLAYWTAILAGSADPFWPHIVLLSVSVLAGIAVGVGIICEGSEFSPAIHRRAKWFVISGVAFESVCTVALFAFDERISQAQQNKIVALETRLAPRTLSDDQLLRIATAVGAYSGTPFDAAVSEDTEPRQLLGRILIALKAAHWDRKPWGGPGVGLALYLEGRAIAFMPLDGVEVAYDPSHEEDFGPPAKALASALNEQGIIATTTTTATVRAEQIRLLVGGKP